MVQIPTFLSLSFLPQTLKLTNTSNILPQPNHNDTQAIKNILQNLKHSSSQLNYPHSFIKLFMLIKINSLSKEQSPVCRSAFLARLVEFYNADEPISIPQDSGEREIFAHILVASHSEDFLTQKILLNILEGDCLVAATIVEATRQTPKYLKKIEQCFALTFLSQNCQRQAFQPIVHLQKNHQGQVIFANKIYELTKYNGKQDKKQVQDPYSIRCSPQINGISYDLLKQMEKDIQGCLNKLHFGFLILDAQEFGNMGLFSQSSIALFDMLMMSLHETAAVSIVRSERMLNNYLTRNKISQNDNMQGYYYLESLMERAIPLMAQNKLLSISTNSDTFSYKSYQKDIFYWPGRVYRKNKTILKNIYAILHLELSITVSVLSNGNNIIDEKCLNQQLLNTLIKLRQMGVGKNCAINRLFKQW